MFQLNEEREWRARESEIARKERKFNTRMWIAELALVSLISGTVITASVIVIVALVA